MQVSCRVYPEVSQEEHLRVRKELDQLRGLAQQKEVVMEEGDLMPDHVHMLLSIPRKYSVSGVVGFIKGKIAIAIARRFMDRTKNFVEEQENKRLDQLKIFD